MSQPGLFDFQARIEDLQKGGNPLDKLKNMIPWEVFRPTLNQVHEKPRKDSSGRRPFDVIVMFKILVLQSLYNLSDASAEFMVRDRLSFMDFLGLELHDRTPDATTIWLFRERLTKLELIESLFEQFNGYLSANGFAAKKGQIIDASIVPAQRQHNTSEEQKQLDAGQTPAEWEDKPAKKEQKDTDARWTKKRGKSYFGYKNHVNVDVKHKFVRVYKVTDAATHDSQVIDDVLDKDNSKDAYADSAYRGKEIQKRLKKKGFRLQFQHRAYRNRPLTEHQKQVNHKRSKIRARVEHVFGVQLQMAKTLVIRTVGKVRAAAKIGLRNIAYNIKRYTVLASS